MNALRAVSSYAINLDERVIVIADGVRPQVQHGDEVIVEGAFFEVSDIKNLDDTMLVHVKRITVH